MRKRYQNNEGYTLIELILYVALLGIMLSALSFFFIHLQGVQTKSKAVWEVEQQGRNALSYMLAAARNAEGINSPLEGQTASTLSLDSVDVSKDPTIFSISNGVLQVTEGGGAAISLTSTFVNVSNFSVKNLSRDNTPGSLEVQFTINANNASGRNEFSYTQIFTGGATLSL